MIAWWFLVLVYIDAEGTVTHTATMNRFRTEEACKIELATYVRQPGLLPQGLCLKVGP